MDYTIREGNYEKLGVQKKDDAVIFTFEGEKEENCSILFYGKKAEPVCKILVPEEYCRGSVRSVAVTGKLWKNLRYNYEINGKIITDTYATRIIGRENGMTKPAVRRIILSVAVHIRRHLTGKTTDSRRLNGSRWLCINCMCGDFPWRIHPVREKNGGHSERLQIKSHI